MPPIPQKTGETEEEEDREDFERAMYQLERLRVEDLERQLRELNEKFLVVTNKEIKRHSENENLKMELIKARDRIEFTEIALKRRENELEETKRLVNSLRDENRNSFEEKFQLRELNEKLLEVTEKETKRHSENENLKMELFVARDRTEIAEIALKRRENELEETKRLVNLLREEKCNSFEEKFQLRELNEKLVEVTNKEIKRHSENKTLKLELTVARDRIEYTEMALKRRETELEETKRLVNLLREEKCNSFEEKFQLRLEKEDLEKRLAMAESSKDDLHRKLRASHSEVNDLNAVLRSQSPEPQTGSRNKVVQSTSSSSKLESTSSGNSRIGAAVPHDLESENVNNEELLRKERPAEEKPCLMLRNEKNKGFMNSVLSSKSMKNRLFQLG